MKPEFKVYDRIFTMVEGGEDRHGQIVNVNDVAKYTTVKDPVQGSYQKRTVTGYTFDISYDEGGTAFDVDSRKIYRVDHEFADDPGVEAKITAAIESGKCPQCGSKIWSKPETEVTQEESTGTYHQCEECHWWATS